MEVANLELTGRDIRGKEAVGPGLTELAVIRVGKRFDVHTDQVGGTRSTMAPKEALACRRAPSGSIRPIPMGAPWKEPRGNAPLPRSGRFRTPLWHRTPIRSVGW